MYVFINSYGYIYSSMLIHTSTLYISLSESEISVYLIFLHVISLSLYIYIYVCMYIYVHMWHCIVSTPHACIPRFVTGDVSPILENLTGRLIYVFLANPSDHSIRTQSPQMQMQMQITR